jgi:hypothetical protein
VLSIDFFGIPAHRYGLRSGEEVSAWLVQEFVGGQGDFPLAQVSAQAGLMEANARTV